MINFKSMSLASTITDRNSDAYGKENRFLWYNAEGLDLRWISDIKFEKTSMLFEDVHSLELVIMSTVIKPQRSIMNREQVIFKQVC